MTPAMRVLTLVQSLALLALVAVFLRPNAAWSIRARVWIALIALACSLALLVLQFV